MYSRKLLFTLFTVPPLGKYFNALNLFFLFSFHERQWSVPVPESPGENSLGKT